MDGRIFTQEMDTYSPITQPLAYTVPNVPYNNSFKPNPLHGTA
jgi:hypothetical protein